MSPSTAHVNQVEDHLASSPARNISEVLDPYQPTISDAESDIYDWQEYPILARDMGIDDVDRHRQPKPSTENVYRYNNIM